MVGTCRVSDPGGLNSDLAGFRVQVDLTRILQCFGSGRTLPGSCSASGPVGLYPDLAVLRVRVDFTRI